MRTSHLATALAALALFSLSSSLAFARPRPPLPPMPELAPLLSRADFDEPFWAKIEKPEAFNPAYVDLVESWSGYALRRAGLSVTPFLVPALDGSGHTNVACANGAVRFWFKSDSSSGMGPGVEARLVELTVVGDKDAVVTWSLSVSPDGASLRLLGVNGAAFGELLTAEIHWQAGEWHSVALNYGPKSSALFIDGNLAAEGAGILPVPPVIAAVALGSTIWGTEPAQGEIDAVTFFGRPLTEAEVAFSHRLYAPTAARGAIAAEEDAAWREAAANRRAEQQAAEAMRLNFGSQSSTNCVTNTLVYITNIVSIPTTNQDSILIFDISGGTNGLLYEIFGTTNLLGTNAAISITNSTWTCLATGMTCTTFFFTNAYHFYVLGTPVDSDSDGLTDAYEQLVSKTCPTNHDTDGDGMWDGWEVHNGLSPLVNDASDDPDGDGATNYEEYLALTDPNSTMVIAWGDNFYGQCNVPAGLRDVVAVAAGHDFSLALRSDGRVIAWGTNGYGQTNVAAEASNTVSIAAGDYHGLALRRDGRPFAWGKFATFATNQDVFVPADLTNVAGIAASFLNALAVRSNGTVVAWGITNADAVTRLPTNLTAVRSVAAGWNHGLALQSNGTVVVWGSSVFGETNAPAGLTNIADIAAGALHSLALRWDGTVVSWGGNFGGETNVPAGLSNVVAVAAGTMFSLALKADGTVEKWGNVASVPSGLSNVVAIAAGYDHGLALRGGRQYPWITGQPQSQCAFPSGTVTFSASAYGLGAVHYQWQFNGTNIAGATNTTLALTNLQPSQAGNYRAIISNGAGASTGQAATLTIPVPFGTPQSQVRLHYGESVTLSVGATNPPFCSSTNFWWTRNGVYLGVLETSTNYTIASASITNVGTHTVLVSNLNGGTPVSWTVDVAGEGSPLWWGSTTTQAWDTVWNVNDTVGLAAGTTHGLVLRENGTLLAWGTNDYGQTTIPAGLTNVTALAAGDGHSLALKENGTVVAWGRNDSSQTNVPTTLTNAVAISAGGKQSLALKRDGRVEQWGQTNAAVPASLTNVAGIASGTNFHLALLSNSTVVAWGANDYGQTNIPAGLTNVVAVAGGGAHALALRVDGTAIAWGSNTSGETNVPTTLTNAMAIAAGDAHSLALRNDGTVLPWGGNSAGQTNVPSWMGRVKLLAAGGNQTAASMFGPFIEYPVTAEQDLLLICNTNSADSVFVKDYYLAHRPLASRANVLGIGYAPQETMLRVDFTNAIRQPMLNWLDVNPTKRPQYFVLMLDVPSRINTDTNIGSYPGTAGPQDYSVSYELYRALSHHPFVTHINMGGTNGTATNDCKAYIDKLEFFGIYSSGGKLILSAMAGGYGGARYVIDGNNVLSTIDGPGSRIVEGLLIVNPSTSIDYVPNGSGPISAATNVAGYFCYGVHGPLGGMYPTNGAVQFSGDSRWYIVHTYESWNGRRLFDHSNPTRWFSRTAFGGNNYENTPVGAITHVDEPVGFAESSVNDGATFYSSWEASRIFGICAWLSRQTPYFQAVGDPLVKR